MDANNTRWIAFLRAVNVGGRFVKMERLRELFTDLGFSNVRTYIQSGNVFFDAEGDRGALTLRIEEALERALGYRIDVMLRTVDELEQTLAARPSGLHQAPETSRLCVFICSGPPPEAVPPPTDAYEILGANGSDLFVLVHLLRGRFPNAAAMLEKRLELRVTVRFLHTLDKMMNEVRLA
jgi:uncharacterized protein (DUF1697 family)